MEAGLRHIGGRAILNSANLEDGELPGSRFDRVFAPRRGVRRGGDLPAHRRARPGARRRVEDGDRPPHPPTSRRRATGCTPSDLIFDALTFPLSTGDDDLRGDAIAHDRGDPPDQGRDPRRVHGARRVQRLLRAQPRGPPRAQQRVPPRVRRRPGSTAAIVHAGQIVPLSQASPTSSARSASTSSTTGAERGLRPAAAAPRGVRRREDDGDRRRRTAPAGRSTSGSSTASSTATATASTDDLDEALAAGTPALDIVNDVLLDGMKVVGELFGSGQMQLPFVLQSAETMKAAVAHLEPHMERVGGETSEGPARARHREGRRPRHRQEPRRHHPHEQRLRGLQPRHQGADRRHGREGQGGRAPTPSA